MLFIYNYLNKILVFNFIFIQTIISKKKKKKICLQNYHDGRWKKNNFFLLFI